MTVVVCTDFSTAAAAGEREAARRFPDSRLVVLHVVDAKLAQVTAERSGLDPQALREDMTNYADQRMDEIIGRLTSQGRQALAEIATGDPVEQTLAAAAKHGAHVVVAGVAPTEAGRFRTVLARKARVAILFVPSAE